MAPKTPRNWFITGCSTGFGRHLAEAALKQGDRVIATARKVEQIQDLEQKYPETAKSLMLDVTDTTTIQNALKEGLKVFGKIDVLVNNAGYGLSGAVEEVSDQQIRDQFETNVFGFLNVTRAFLPFFRQQGSGHILNISSLAGRIGIPTMGIYNGSKFALEGISESLAQELKPFGIKVTIVEPGGFATDFSSRSLAVASPMPEYQSLREEMDKYRANFVLGDVPTGVQTILKIVDMTEPPLRLVLGPNSLPRLLQKLSSDLEAYKLGEALWQTSTPNGKRMNDK
jgi:NAD(P)-dependent dehydrogenase (short-subunit alcohol dehydrogenase family)